MECNEIFIKNIIILFYVKQRHINDIIYFWTIKNTCLTNFYRDDHQHVMYMAVTNPI